MYKILFRLGLRPRPHMGSLYSAPPLGKLTALILTPWLHLRDPTSKGKRGRGNEWEKEDWKRSLDPNLHRSTCPQVIPSITCQVFNHIPDFPSSSPFSHLLHFLIRLWQRNWIRRELYIAN